MNKRILYCCSYCGKEFNSKECCLEHEENHDTSYDYSDCSDQKISEELRRLANRASAYHMFGEVVGMPLHSFENLMTEAARRIVDKENT